MKHFQLDSIDKGDLIAVAMSGGVDSSVAAALMVEAGYNVIGITLQLYDQGEMAKRKGACCAGQDIYDAKMVADKLGFPHYVLDYESIFKQQVIEDFVDSYSKGETPIPCIQCNQKVKFKDLLKTAKDLGAKALVTGHYVKRLQGNTKSELHRAVDYNRDQSYFLFTTTQEQLDYLRFPLGGIPKSETREHAKRFDLQIADKPDSQDICFVPNGNYVSVIEKLKPGALEPGDITHVDGTILGRHEGTIQYTIGQRRGLGISSKEPLYVVRINPEHKQVIVGTKEHLAVHDIYLKDVNLLENATLFKDGYECSVKIRSTHAPVKATVLVNADNIKHARVHFENPEYGVANGQACVFYKNDRVLGGGWITEKQYL
ncbi:MAG: tRNA 2-thiouridine(34) synthase MnmA [Alphaproteobacteria bacterium CG_4_10_14_0_8_um_filter_37_21]|nr:MAG: tRNA 2-thiouridine(34) synthase MnmA [Alphaproteobacteria bacterium CG_4_10_14_0_8_um_filter_37_21]